MTNRGSNTSTDPQDEPVEEAALALAEQLGREAIELARERPAVLRSKADALDVVTAADVAIERRFRARIGEEFPEHGILGEEQGLERNAGEWTWIVDPIDGTFNYATRLVGVGSSIALIRRHELRVGVVADFGLGTVLSARKGGGIRSSEALPADDPWGALGRVRLLVDPGHQVPDPSVFGVLERMAALSPLAPRLIGSGAVSLAAVAHGGGCFVGSGLEIWDAAAGMLLAEERGHAVRWWRLAGDRFHHVLAGEPELVRVLEPLMPAFVEAWRRKTSADGSLLGPSDAILVD
jgi:myo-inositol-1(or 4)-monophosphatase